MVWIFVTVILLLLVYHAPFRKFMLRGAAVALVLGAIAITVILWPARPKQPIAQTELPLCAPQAQTLDPYAWTELVPGDLNCRLPPGVRPHTPIAP